MNRDSEVPAAQLSGRASEGGQDKLAGAPRIHIFEVALWVLGVVILGIAAVLVHSHTPPWPFELAFTKSIQHPQRRTKNNACREVGNKERENGPWLPK